MSDADDLRELVAEAHGAIKDLKGLLRELNQVKRDITVMVGEQASDLIHEQVSAGLAAYRDTVDSAVVQATEAVFGRFDTISNLLIGKGSPTDIEKYAADLASRKASVLNILED